MGIFDKLFRKKLVEEQLPNKQPKETSIPETYKPIDLPEGELVSFSDEVLDTNSRESIEKLKHNLKILIKQAKETGKIDKFMLIREDDFFPDGWEWRVLSKNTNWEKVCTPLSYELKETYALEQSGIKPYMESNGIKIPCASREQIIQELSNIDKTIGSILLPSRFRSTKHFTVNTPLEVTGDYNSVSVDRNFIFIDDISAFLASEYGYSVSYHDAYLDVSHESLPISKQAVVLIKDENYDKIMSDKKVASELAQRRVVRFTGDPAIAINMILTEMGVLPSKVSWQYAEYDQEIYDILDRSMKDLAEENNLFFDKSHGGQLKPDGGHFSNYYDDKNQDDKKALNEFVDFLRKKFPEQEKLFPENLIFTSENAQEIVETLGTDNLLAVINEYNALASEKSEKALKEYIKDRKSITPEIHQLFVKTINLINDFYKNNVKYDQNVETVIQKFIQGGSVKEQVEAAKKVWELLHGKNFDKAETSVGDRIIMPIEAIKNALGNELLTKKVNKPGEIKQLKLHQDKNNKGVIR